MSEIALVPLLVALGALAWTPKVWVWPASRRRRPRAPVVEPIAWVRVLRSAEELDEALDRARHYEEEAEVALRRRIERYRASLTEPAGAVVALRADDQCGADCDGHKTA